MIYAQTFPESLFVFIYTDTVVFSMRTHTFIYQINCKMNRKYSQDIDKVKNNDFNFNY